MEPRLAKLARLGIEPDALVILEQYGKTLPRDIKYLTEEDLARMKLKGNQLGKLQARKPDEKKPQPEPEAVPAKAVSSAKAAPKRKAAAK